MNELFTDSENKWEEVFFFPKNVTALEKIADKKYSQRRLNNEIWQFFTTKTSVSFGNMFSFPLSFGEKRRSLFFLLCTESPYSKIENLFCWNYFLRHNKGTEGINSTNLPSPRGMRGHITEANRHIYKVILQFQQDLFSIANKPLTYGDMSMESIKTLVTKKTDNKISPKIIEKRNTTFQTISQQGSFSVHGRCKSKSDTSSALLWTSRSRNFKKATNDLLKNGKNINRLPSPVLFPRWSKPIGIAMWVWNRRSSRLNKCSYNVRTEIECVLLGTCTKALISKSIPITFGNKASPTSINSVHLLCTARKTYSDMSFLLPGETKIKHITEGNINRLKNTYSNDSITFHDVSFWKNTCWHKRWKENTTLFNESKNLLVDQQLIVEGKVQNWHIDIKETQNLLPSVICPTIFLKASLLCSCSFFGCFALHPMDQKHSKSTQQVTPGIIRSKKEAAGGTTLTRKVSFQESPFAHTFFLYFNTFEKDKKELYWPIIVSFFPKALQRRVVKLFLMQQNWKKIQYSQIENFLKLKKSY